ncbi:MAG TPA: ParB N-terminal domain-containing protein [Vicinamibacterales bacterium]|nr:ParB N-terminal domain-containing protein [Vicinamibacterales bacterium]
MTATLDEISSPSGDASRSLLRRLLSSAQSLPPDRSRQALVTTFPRDSQPHACDRFESAPPLVQLIPLASIDTAGALPDVATELVQSIMRNGVLEPVLLRAGSERPVLVSGRRRVSAAIRAGLKVIPALVVTLTDEEALAVNATDRPALRASGAGEELLQTGTLQELSGTVTLLGTCAHLAADAAGSISSRAALDLMDAEIWRATTLVSALRTVQSELRLERAPTTAGAIIDRVLMETALARRLMGISDVLRTESVDERRAIRIDPTLTVAALSGLLAVLFAWAESKVTVQMAMSATMRDGTVCFTFEQHGIDVPASWLDHGFATSVADRRGSVGILLWLLQARRVALAHGGHAELHKITGGSSMTLTLGGV